MRNSYGNEDAGCDTSVTNIDEGDQVLSSSGTVSKCLGIEIADGSDKLDDKKGEDEGACPKSEQLISSSEEKVWEECGCILWDLSASKSHAELMVLKFPSYLRPHTLFSPLVLLRQEVG